MSLEPNLAALVAASTQLTKSIAMPLSVVTGKRDAATTAEADITSAESAIATAATTATTDAATTASKLTAAAADYATQKTTKGLAAVQTSADSELKDRLHRRDPAHYPFRGARPSLVMDFVRQECHRNNAAGNLEPVDLSTFMTFTRGSTATYVGPDGLIKTAGVNEARYGYDPVTGEALGLLIEEQRTNLTSVPVGPVFYAWDTRSVLISRSNLISPSGMLDVIKVYEKPETTTEFYLRTSAGTLTAQTLCMSVYVHSSSERTLQLRAVHTSCALPTSEVSFVMATKTFGSTSGYITSTGYVDAGNGWYRVWIVFTTPSTSVVQWGANLTGGTTTGDGVSGVYLWGFQLEAGSFHTSYIPTPATFTGRASTKTYFDSNGVMQTAASGVAVTDYGYVDGRWVSKGLSLEPKATNLVLQSQNFSGCGVTAASISGAKTTAPDGTVSGTPLTPDAAATLNSHTTILYFGAYDGTQKTFSAFVKSNGLNRVRLRMVDNSTSASTSIVVNLTDGSIFTAPVSNASWTGVNGSVTPVSNGWYRITVTGTGVGGGTVTAGILPYDSVLTTGDGVKGLYIWGAQLETGPVATSYIPTTTTQVTRAADTSTSAQVTRAAEYTYCSVANWVDVNGGTLHARTGGFISHAWGAIAQIDDGQSNSARILMDGSAGNKKPRLFVNQNAAEGLSVTDDTTLTSMASASIAGRYGQSVNAISYNGRATYSAGSGVPFGRKPPSRFCVGCIGMAYQLNGYIRQLTYFPRQLSDADLQALTILED